MDWSASLLCLLVVGLAWAEETCHSADEDPYLLFGTKTSYIFATRGLPSTKAHEVPGCQPKAFWMLSRQGSHVPEANVIPHLQALSDLKNNIVSNYNNGHFRDLNNRMCSSDLNLLKAWEWNNRHNLTFAGDLTSDGYMSTQQLAQAFKHKFPGLLTGKQNNYLAHLKSFHHTGSKEHDTSDTTEEEKVAIAKRNEKNVAYAGLIFKFGSDQRSKTTFRSFTEGLLGAKAEGLDIPKENDEKLVYPYKSCQVWSKDVEDNNETLSQKQIFESKMEYREMLSNISQRLGFKYDVERETILSIYQMCAYNKAWDVAKISPWCAAFSREDLKRLEYAEDLETYYKYGYGSPLRDKIGCLPIKDMFNFFSNHISEEIRQLPLSMITFTDSEMLLVTLAALNTRYDTAPLTGDNYRTPTVQGRKWTTSTMVPFNGNLAAVLYKCTQNGNFQVKDQYQVLFLENEKPMYIEECRVGLCDWSLVKHRYSELVGKCNLEFCNGAERIAIGFSLVIGLFISRILV